MNKTVPALLISLSLLLFGTGLALAATGGPDDFGYTFIDSNEAAGPTYSLIDISGTGTLITSGDDNAGGPANIGFDFPFYGNSFNQLYVGTNGYVTFGYGTTTLSNITMPNDNYYNMIAVCWDDIVDSAYYQYFDDCPHPDFSGPCLVVMWNGVYHWSGTGNWKMNIILFPNGDILMQHSSGNPELGSGSTTGINGSNGTDGLLYAINTPGSLTDNLAILFINDTGDDDGDGMPNYFENMNGLDKDDPSDAATDLDGDGLTNLEEFQLGLKPNDSDTDNDDLSDGDEIEYGSDPLVTDSDADGLDDGEEVHDYGTDPVNSDSDNDGIPDGVEVNMLGTDPNSTDTDSDWLGDYDEVEFYDSDPTEPDTDNDGLSDWDEVIIWQTNPYDYWSPGPYMLRNLSKYSGENSLKTADDGDQSYVVYSKDEDTFLGMKCFITAAGAGTGSLGTVLLSVLAACAGFLARMRNR